MAKWETDSSTHGKGSCRISEVNLGVVWGGHRFPDRAFYLGVCVRFGGVWDGVFGFDVKN